MSFATSLFCAKLLLCGVIVLCESLDVPLFMFTISKEGSYVGELSTEYSFEEGVEYTVQCVRYSDRDLHWEVEPYGLKSSSFSSSSGGITYLRMTFKLNRDDVLSIGCYSKNKETLKEENKSTTFIWDKKEKPVATAPTMPKPVSMDARDVFLKVSNITQHNITQHGDEEERRAILDGADDNHKCYQKNNTEKCAFLLITKELLTEGSRKFDLQMYSRNNNKNHDNINSIDIDKCYQHCYCTNTNENFFCECHQGYIKNATGWCEDANECQLNICKYGERCWNTDGSYTCCPKATILDKDGYCVCPESNQHKYYRTMGCVYDQCLNTTCGLGAECSMAKAKPTCYCPFGTTGNPHENCVDSR